MTLNLIPSAKDLLKVLAILMSGLFACTQVNAQCGPPTSAQSQSGCPGTYTLTVYAVNSSVTSVRWYTAPTGGAQITPSTNESVGSGVWRSTYTHNFTSSVTYYVACVCGWSEGPRVPISYTNTSGTVSISASSDPMAVVPGSTFSLTSSSGSSYWKWGNNSSGYLSTNNTIYPEKGGVYYLSGTTNCGTSGSASMQVNFLPVADAGIDQTVSLPTSSLQIYGSGSDQDGDPITFAWSKISGPAVTLSNINTSVLGLSGLTTGTYVFRLTVTDSYNKSSSDDVTVQVLNVANNTNYTLTETINIPGQLNESQVGNLTIGDKDMLYAYMDGLGSSLQAVSAQASPSQNDIIIPYEYDELHRKKRSYLPVEQSQNTGYIVDDLLGNGAYVGSDHYNFYNPGSNGVPTDTKPYKETAFELTPLGRPVTKGATGSGFQPGESDVDISYGANAYGAIIIWGWNESTKLPVAGSTYEDGTLPAITTTTADDTKTQQVSDLNGLKLVDRIQLTSGILSSTWAETYYVYDSRKNLRCVLPAELIKILTYNGLRSPTQTEMDALAYQYVYDDEHRIVEEKGPGTGWMYTIYDSRGREVLSQDAKQRVDNEWNFTKYDEHNRPVVTGTYSPGTYVSRISMQSTVDALNGGKGYQNVTGSSTAVFPTSNYEELTVTYYDNYADCNICQDASYQFVPETFTTTSNEPFQKFERLKGQIVGSSIKVLDSDQWLHSVIYYNRHGDVIQTFSTDHRGGITRSSTLVDFTGLPLATKTIIDGNTITERFEYDHAGRPLKKYHKLNSQPEVIIAKYNYNALGQVINKDLHSENGGSTWLQSLDYAYTIRGQLSQLNALTGNSGQTDYFGMELVYNTAISGAGNTPRYDGNLSAIQWSSDLSGKSYLYNFSYDKQSQLTAASYKKHDSGSWTDVDKFSENNISYDLNGNIKTLNRKRKGATIDQLTYDYGSIGNQLLNVTDAGTDDGFKDGTNAGNDFNYDVNGNVVMDENKGMGFIDYNQLNLPDSIAFSDGSYILYTYDAGGIRLSEDYHNNAGESILKTDYADNLIYLNDTLITILHDEGRIVPPAFKNLITNREANSLEGFTPGGNVTLSSVAQNGQTYVKAVCNQTTGNPGIHPIGQLFSVKPGERYAFKILGYRETAQNASLYVWGNSGNIIWPGALLPQGLANETWVTAEFTIPANVTQIKVGVLWNNPASGATLYINYAGLYKLDWEYQYFITDHQGSPRVVLQTDQAANKYTGTMESENLSDENTKFLNIQPSFIEVNPAANATPGGNEVIRMNSSYSVGPARSIKVYPGDIVNAQVSAYYPTASGLSAANRANIAAALASVMAGGDQTIIDGINTAYNTSGNSNIVLAPNQGMTKPSAFLNYILFDEGYQVLEAKSAALGNANTLHVISTPQVNIKEVGILFIYLSYDNANPNPVYFDELKITHQESPVIQVNSYYPFGMTAYSWIREGEKENKYLYQNKEYDSLTGWHDFQARQYDGSLGRWFASDPKHQFASPYSAMGNIPMISVDPDGRFVWFIPVVIGGFINVALNAKSIQQNGGGLLQYFGVGAVAGALSAGTGTGVNVAMAGGSFGAGFTGAATGVASTGFLSGAATGAVAGFTNGFITGLGNNLLSGNSFSSSLESGLKTGGIQGLIGGITGGIIGGLDARVKDLNFWNGTAKLNLSEGAGAHGIIPDKGRIVGKYVGKFEGVNVYETPELGTGYGSGGITLPRRGITVGKGVFSRHLDFELLQHEFGHVLQINQLGGSSFLTDVGWPSFRSAMKDGTNGWNHNEFWTEVWANNLSKSYFEANYSYLSQPWNYTRFPLTYRSHSDYLKVLNLIRKLY